MAEGLKVTELYLYIELNNPEYLHLSHPLFLISFKYTDNDGLQKQESDDVEIELHGLDSFFRDNLPVRASNLKC